MTLMNIPLIKRRERPIFGAGSYDLRSRLFVVGGLVSLVAAILAFNVYDTNKSSLDFGDNAEATVMNVADSTQTTAVYSENGSLAFSLGASPTVSPATLSSVSFNPASLSGDELEDYNTKEARLYEELNTNAVFNGVDDIYQLLEYTEYDDDGYLSKAGIESLLEIADGANN